MKGVPCLGRIGLMTVIIAYSV